MSELDFLKLEGLSQTLVLGKRSAFHHLPLRLVITDRYELANALRPYARPRGAELPRLKSFVRRISLNRKPLETDDVARHFAAALLSAGYCALRLQRDVGGELPIELASDIKPIEATNIHNARPEDKYARVLELVPQYLPGEMRGAFAELVSPAAIGTTVGVLVLWAGSHALGVGFAIDVLLLAIGFAMVGWSIFGAVGDVIDFFKIMGTARNDADLNQAAQKLAGAIAALGVGTFIALLTRGAGRIAAAKKASVPRKSGGGGAPASDAQIAKYKSKTEDAPRKKKRKASDEQSEEPLQTGEVAENPDTFDKLDAAKVKASNRTPVKPLVDPSTNVASAKRTQHILYGDSTGGGHLWPGGAGKTPFPKDWDANKVMSTTSDIATDPNLFWKPQTGNGGLYTKSGKPSRFVVTDANGNLPVIEGVPVQVIVEPAGEGIITSYPKY